MCLLMSVFVNVFVGFCLFQVRLKGHNDKVSAARFCERSTKVVCVCLCVCVSLYVCVRACVLGLNLF